MIDFGSVCFSDERIYTTIQSRYYRAPEIILDLSYNCQIEYVLRVVRVVCVVHMVRVVRVVRVVRLCWVYAYVYACARVSAYICVLSMLSMHSVCY